MAKKVDNTIHIFKNQLKSLVVSLLILVAGGAARAGITVPAPRMMSDTLPRVTEIWLEGGNFIALDTRQCDSLTAVNCADEKLFTLNVDECPSLTTINCAGNRLKTLNLSDNLALQRLICSGNALTELNVSQNHALIRVRCSDNPIESLDVSGLTKLSEMEADIPTMLSFKAVGCVKLENLFIGKAIKELDLSKCVLLEAAPLFGATEVVRLDSCLNLKILEKIEERLNLQQLSARKTALINVDVSNSLLQNIDLSYCNALVKFNCSRTRLRELDLSTCKNMRSLYADSTPLESINVSGLSMLEVLCCHDNALLTKLNISGCTALKEVRASGNRLRSIRGSSDKLQIFQVSDNGLPFSQLYPFLQNRKEGTIYNLSRQTDTISLQTNTTFDLNREIQIGGQATKWELLTMSNTVVPANHYSAVDGVFRMLEPGEYKLKLTNPAIQTYNNGVDAEDVEFVWYIKATGPSVANEDYSTSNQFVYAVHKVIHLSEPMGPVQVYNILGRCIYSGTDTEIPVKTSGLYVVRSRYNTFKISVK